MNALSSTAGNQPPVACLLCGASVAPFHVFPSKALINKPLPQPQATAVVDMAVAFCPTCRHISSRLDTPNDISEIEKAVYGQAYEGYVPTGLSPLQLRYTELVAGWLDGWLPRGARVLEIGCHDGFFLELLVRRGHRCEGVEPSPFADLARGRGLDVHQGFFDPASHPAGAYDAVIMRHVVEHVRTPVDFVASAVSLLAPQGIAFVEVPNSLGSIQEAFYPEFHTDHVSYFTPASLTTLLERVGLGKILHLESFHGYLKFPFMVAIAQPGSSPAPQRPGWLIDFQVSRLLAEFPARFARYVERLRSLSPTGLALWGTGSIGTQFAIDAGWGPQDVIVVDPNPVNHGKVLSVTGQPVRAPRAIEDADCTAVLIASAWESDVRVQLANAVTRPLNVYSFSDLVS